MTLIGIPIRRVIQDLLPGAEYGFAGQSGNNNELDTIIWRDRQLKKPTEQEIADHWAFMQVRDAQKPSEIDTEGEYGRLAGNLALVIDMSRIKTNSDFERLVLRRLERLERLVGVENG